MGKYSLVYVIDTPSLLSITYIVFPVFSSFVVWGLPFVRRLPFWLLDEQNDD